MKPRVLVSDTKKVEQEPNTYPHGKNGIWNANLDALQNEKGFRVSSVSWPYKYIGVIETDTYPVIFTTDNTNSAAGYWDTDTDSYTPIFDDADLPYKFGFNLQNPIKGEARRNYRNELELTWLELGDNRNPPRWLNTIRLGTDLNDFLLFPESKTPYVELSMQAGGNLGMGAYYIGAKYIKNDGTETRYTTLTSPLIAVSDNWTTIPGGNTGKALQITITGADTTYDRIGLVVVERLNGVDTAYELPELSIAETINFLYTGSEKQTQLTIEEVIIPSGYYVNARAITQLNDQLFLGNMEEEVTIDWQKYANLVNVRWKSDLTVGRDPGVAAGKTRGWMHEEVLSLSIVLRLKNGRNSRAFILNGTAPISSDLITSTIASGQAITALKYQVEDTCRNIDLTTRTGDPGVWLNQDEVYPNTPEFDSSSVGGEDLRGKPVRHFKMPTINFCKKTFYNTNINYGRNYLDVLGLEVTNVIIPPELADKVTGWELHYAKRDFNNATVMGQSLLLFGAQGQEDKTTDNNITSTGGNWGSYTVDDGKFTEGPTALFVKNNHIRFHAFDLLNLRPSISPSHLSLQLSLGIRMKNSIVKSGADQVNYSSDYGNEDNAYTPVAVADNRRIRKITQGQYITDGQVSGDYNNIRLEDAYVAKLTTPGDLMAPGQWAWAKRDYNNGSLQVHPDHEDTWLANLITLRRNVYVNYYSQTLVRTGYVFPSELTNSNRTIYGGDTFVSYYGFTTYGLVTKLDTVDDTGKDGWHTLSTDGFKVARIFLCETVSNVQGRYQLPGNSYSRFYPKDSLSFLAELSRNTNPNQIGYSKDTNAVGDLLNGIKIASPLDDFIGESPYKITRSVKQTREGKINSWKNFNALDYYETVKDKGPITNLQGYGDKLIIHHKDGFFVTRDKATLSTDILKVTLGTGDIFQFEPEEGRPTKLGYAGTTNPLACVLTPAGYIFPDTRTGELFLFNGQLGNIGTGIINFLLKYLTVKELNSYIGNGITIGYEHAYNRILLTCKNSRLNTSNLVFVPGYAETPEFFATLTPNISVVFREGRFQVFKGLNSSEYECDLNPLPQVPDYAFTSDEHVPNGTLLGTAVAAGGTEPYTYLITTVDKGGVAVHPVTGRITIQNSTAFDYTRSVLELILQVTDANGHTDTGTVSITINQIESSPVVPNYSHITPEHTADGTVMVDVNATDRDGKAITYSIVGGNELGGFAIDPATGIITVADSDALDYETTPVFTIIVRATAGTKHTDGSVVITLTYVATAPVVTNTTFNALNTRPNGTTVFTAAASSSGGDLIYELEETNDAYTIDIDPGSTDFMKVKVLDITKTLVDNNPYQFKIKVYEVSTPLLFSEFTVTGTVYECPFQVDTDVTGETDTTAKIQLTPSKGIGPYTYLWSNSQTSSLGTGLIKDQDYTVDITDTATGCVVTLTLTPNIEVLSGLKVELMYFQNSTVVTTDPYYPRLGTGGHNCNRARFEVFANAVSQGIANLNNNGGTSVPDGTIDDLNRAPEYPAYASSDPKDRYWRKNFSKGDAIEIANPDGTVTFSLSWTGIDPMGPHTNSSWLRITKDSGVIILSTTLDITTTYEFDPYA